jgi:hypothetical protein
VNTNGFSTGRNRTRGRFFQYQSILVGTERNGSGRPPTNFECGAFNRSAHSPWLQRDLFDLIAFVRHRARPRNVGMIVGSECRNANHIMISMGLGGYHPSHAVRPLCAMSPEALHRRQGQLFRSARIDISVAWHLSAKEKPARRSNLTGRAGLATTRRVVVSSMAILPTGRVSVESIEVLWSLRKAPLGAGLKESSGATPPPVLIC